MLAFSCLAQSKGIPFVPNNKDSFINALQQFLQGSGAKGNGEDVVLRQPDNSQSDMQNYMRKAMNDYLQKKDHDNMMNLFY